MSDRYNVMDIIEARVAEGRGHEMSDMVTDLIEARSKIADLTKQRDDMTAEVTNYCAGYRTQIAELTAERDEARKIIEETTLITQLSIDKCMCLELQRLYEPELVKHESEG